MHSVKSLLLLPLLALFPNCRCLLPNPQYFWKPFSTDHQPLQKERNAPKHILWSDVLCHQSFFDRRRILGSIWHSYLVSIVSAESAKAAPLVETIGKDPKCNDAFCLGVWDGFLADCPHPSKSIAGCVSSQDDTPRTFAEPWDYSEVKIFESLSEADLELTLMQCLVDGVHRVSSRRGDLVDILLRQGRYLHVLITDANSREISHGEFYITPNDTTVHFRLCSTGNILGPFTPTSLKNMDRAELLRKELHFLKLPILRNRQRSFLFLESDFDSFGPRSAALGPSEEMKSFDQL